MPPTRRMMGIRWKLIKLWGDSLKIRPKSAKMMPRNVPKAILEADRFLERSQGGPPPKFLKHFGATCAIWGAILGSMRARTNKFNLGIIIAMDYKPYKVMLVPQWALQTILILRLVIQGTLFLLVSYLSISFPIFSIIYSIYIYIIFIFSNHSNY